MKIITKRITNLWLLLSIVIVLVLIPQVSATPAYYSAFQKVYGNNSCGVCHMSQDGGDDLIAYGNKFMSQPNYSDNSEKTLRTIGAPPGMVPIATETVGTMAEQATDIPDETTEKESPGFDIIATIGIISAMYMLGRDKKKK